MIPTIENSSLDFPKFIVSVCPQDYPTNYQILLKYSCISLLPEVERIYIFLFASIIALKILGIQ